MFFIVWEFHVKREQFLEFERHYSGSGTWARFFRQDPAYKETILLRDSKMEGRYLTTDIWCDEAAYTRFQEKTLARYLELDAEFAALTEREALVGYFEVVE